MMSRFAFFAVTSAILIASCRTQSPNQYSAAKDVGVIDAAKGTMQVVYEEQGKVYLKNCKPVTTPPLTRSCDSDKAPEDLGLDYYLNNLPYDTGSYDRNESNLEKNLIVVSKLLSDATAAVAGGNQLAANTVRILTPIKGNLEFVVKIRGNLKQEQRDLTYYEYHDEFLKLKKPFAIAQEAREQDAGRRAEEERRRLAEAERERERRREEEARREAEEAQYKVEYVCTARGTWTTKGSNNGIGRPIPPYTGGIQVICSGCNKSSVENQTTHKFSSYGGGLTASTQMTSIDCQKRTTYSRCDSTSINCD